MPYFESSKLKKMVTIKTLKTCLIFWVFAVGMAAASKSFGNEKNFHFFYSPYSGPPPPAFSYQNPPPARANVPPPVSYQTPPLADGNAPPLVSSPPPALADNPPVSYQVPPPAPATSSPPCDGSTTPVSSPPTPSHHGHHHHHHHHHHEQKPPTSGSSTPPPSTGDHNEPPPSSGGSPPSPPTPSSGYYYYPPPSTTSSPPPSSTPSTATPPSSTSAPANSPPSDSTPSTTPPSNTPSTGTTPPSPPVDPSIPFFGGTCDFWKQKQKFLTDLFWWWRNTIGKIMGFGSLFPRSGADMNILEALSNTRTDGYGALYREGTAAYLNSIVNINFPFTTSHVRDSFVAALASDNAAAAQAHIFRLANEGHLKPRV